MLNTIIAITQEAGNIIIPYFQSQNLDTQYKRDENDPVTAADFASDSFIKEQLKKHFPQDQILTEETANNNIDRSDSVWIVDPLDGTMNFTNQKNEFCVMIGHCINGIPDLGVVYFPATGLTYYAENGKGAYVMKQNGKKSLLQTNKSRNTLEDAIIHCSKGTERFVLEDQIVTDLNTGKKIVALRSARCLGYSDCKICEGDLDAIITFHNRTGKRDTCAAQVILQEAGGTISNIDGSPLQYTQHGSYREGGHVAGTKDIHREIIEFLN